jgi:hypothetical protein
MGEMCTIVTKLTLNTRNLLWWYIPVGWIELTIMGYTFKMPGKKDIEFLYHKEMIHNREDGCAYTYWKLQNVFMCWNITWDPIEMHIYIYQKRMNSLDNSDIVGRAHQGHRFWVHVPNENANPCPKDNRWWMETIKQRVDLLWLPWLCTWDSGLQTTYWGVGFNNLNLEISLSSILNLGAENIGEGPLLTRQLFYH